MVFLEILAVPMVHHDNADRERSPVEVVNLPRIAREATRRLAWSGTSEDLQLNLLVLDSGEAVEEHVNAEVDVLLVGIEGSGAIEIDGIRHRLGPGRAVIVPRRSRRSISGTGDRFAYLSCHRRRGGLWPTRSTQPQTKPEQDR